ncbi:MAG: tRNA lysidine(34) synthetase TilS, partial [Alphaproteobacteria bacterium]|nr:tRNA lysidine(34) synthetase TilS [Alphaproteobacteria bacterium]MBX9977443.1 tRNA lysidine(34) synthetase TilS [Alphaproteobacteria bacterium]
LELCLEKGAPYLMTAHHKDDQIETFFLRLFKGSGTKGLGAMKMHTVIQHNNRPHITLLRPLLDIAKKDLLAYLKEIGQDFITDPSNENKAFERVKLRHMISNLRHQNFDVDAIMETVDHCQQQSSFIDNIIEKHKAECFQENTLDIQKFLALESFLQKTLLREYLWHLSGKDYPPKFHAINNAIELLRAGKTFTRAGYVFKRSTDHYVMIKENR